MAFDPLTAAFEIGGKVLDRIFPDPEQRDKAKIKLIELQQNGELAKLAAETELARGQQAINSIEAGHKKLFVSAWRPFLGWCCGGAFAYHFILQPILLFAFAVFGIVVDLPVFDISSLLTVLMGMLGLGGLRTFEKLKKIS